MKKIEKGIAIEYALIMMGIISVFIVVILTCSVSSIEKTSIYKKYMDQKTFIDEVGTYYVYCKNNKEMKNFEQRCNDSYRHNNYDIAISYSNTELTMIQGRKVILYVEFQVVDRNYQLITYRYGLA